VIIVGHTRCGGVEVCLRAAANDTDAFPEDGPDAPVNWWLQLLVQIATEIQVPNGMDCTNVVTEESVKVQVNNICNSEMIKAAWVASDPATRGIYIHGWVYSMHTQMLKDLEISRSPPKI
ncbi:hypothetical protein NEOLEDRAFT_1064155, partial [Neolentinus lepideus HHB14362 ss-1]